MTGTPFPVDPELTGIAIAYRNAEMIADAVAPRLQPTLKKQTFKYQKYDFGQMITIPDTKVGRKSEPNTMEFGGTDATDMTEDFGQDSVIPMDDITQGAEQGFDPRGFAVTQLTNIVALDREKRVADKVFSAAPYIAANVEVLAGASQWSSTDSSPVKSIKAAQDKMIMPGNVLILGREVWTKLSTNASLLRALNPSGASDGVANRRAVADLLELDEILVGSGWANAAKPGQAPVRYRLWGKHAALIRREKIVSSLGEVPTFAWTAQYGDKVAGSLDEPKIGLRGSVRVRSGESVREVFPANELGYLFQNAIA